MPLIHRTAIVPYSPEEMYVLVDDVDKYSEFIPWCVASSTQNRSEDEVHGRLEFAKGGVQKAFTTCNRLQHGKMIEIRLLNGPFKQLEGFWRFEPLPKRGCKIIFDLEFEFSSRLLAMVFGPIFTQISQTLVDAFVKRAREVYKVSQ